MAGYVLSPHAKNSLMQISIYTLNNFGEVQRKQYLSMLRERMRLVAGNPGHGHDRGQIKSGYFCIQASKHTIYYRLADEHVEIIDVLHQSIEPDLQL